MLQRLLNILIALVVAVVGVSCDGADEPSPTPTPSGEAKRTLLVYIAANNSLATGRNANDEYYDDSDIGEMQRAAEAYGLNGCRVLLYHHTHTSRGLTPTLYELTAKGQLEKVKEYDYDEKAVDASRMSRVIADVKSWAPARDYGLVLWSHATGWLAPDNEGNTSISRAFGDEREGSKHYRMSVPTLARVLDGQGFSFVYFDCCNMATVEVAYELRHATQAIVASVSELPGDGMPYDRTLPILLSDSPDLAAAARTTFDYYNALNTNIYWCSMSVVSTASLEALADATRTLYAAAEATPERRHVQAFMSGNVLSDFGHYVELMEAPAEAKEAWQQAFDNVVGYQACTPYVQVMGSRWRVNRHCGLGTYIVEKPGDEAFSGYNTLEWYNAIYR